ncbi:MAG: SusD/RagB family nutrient-binding outer membrane lipoprotein [Cyclobacteriaceae bacterium]
MKKTFIYKWFATLFVLFLVAGCESDFLDINDDPNNPTSAPVSQLLASAQVDIAGALGNSIGGLSAIPQAYTQQVFQRGITEQDYGVRGTDFEVITPWNILYTRGLMDLEELITLATEQEALQYVGVAQILKAYSFSLLVDMYGDVPFTEAFQGTVNPSPTYDLGENVYPQLFTLLDEGINNLAASSSAVVGVDDLFYGGDLNLWRKFAKTLKLKMYNQVRLVQDVSADVGALIADDDMLSSQSEDFEFQYGTSTAPENRNPAYVQEYTPGAAQFYINPFFYETMAVLNTFGHRNYGDEIGLVDPRIPYYFYNQLAPGQNAENPCSYCDLDVNGVQKVPELAGTGFLSIYMFSFNIDPNEGFSQSSSQTVPGIYPVGGRYDDGQGGIANFNGDGTTPQRLLTYFARKYIEAELYHTGVTTGDARAAFEEAMRASFAKVDQVASAASSQTVPALDTDAVDAYVDAVLTSYDAADADGKLEHIITQKWIASFGWGCDVYSDFRRTGFPILHDGNTDNLSITNRTREFPFALPWVDQNLQINANAPAQKQIGTAEARVFWDPS